MSPKFLLIIKQAEIGIQSHWSCCAQELPMQHGCLVATIWWISTSFTYPKKNAIKAEFLRTYFTAILILNLHAGRAGTEVELKAQGMQSHKQDFQRGAFVQNWYLLPSTCTDWWNPKWQTLNVCTESVVWAASMHWARRLRELAALDNSSGVWGVSTCCPRAVWLLRTACCNPESKLFTTFSMPHGNIWQFTAESLVAFNAWVSLSYNLFSFYWIETQFSEFLNSLANIIKLPWLLGNDFKKS